MIKYPPINWNQYYDNFTSKEDWEIADKFYNKKITLFKKAKLIKKLDNDKVKILVGYTCDDNFSIFLVKPSEEASLSIVSTALCALEMSSPLPSIQINPF